MHVDYQDISPQNVCVSATVIMVIMFGCSVKLAQGQVWETKAFEFGAARLGQTTWVCYGRVSARSFSSICMCALSCAFYRTHHDSFFALPYRCWFAVNKMVLPVWFASLFPLWFSFAVFTLFNYCFTLVPFHLRIFYNELVSLSFTK